MYTHLNLSTNFLRTLLRVALIMLGTPQRLWAESLVVHPSCYNEHCFFIALLYGISFKSIMEKTLKCPLWSLFRQGMINFNMWLQRAKSDTLIKQFIDPSLVNKEEIFSQQGEMDLHGNSYYPLPFKNEHLKIPITGIFPQGFSVKSQIHPFFSFFSQQNYQDFSEIGLFQILVP